MGGRWARHLGRRRIGPSGGTGAGIRGRAGSGWRGRALWRGLRGGGRQWRGLRAGGRRGRGSRGRGLRRGHGSRGKGLRPGHGWRDEGRRGDGLGCGRAVPRRCMLRCRLGVGGRCGAPGWACLWDTRWAGLGRDILGERLKVLVPDAGILAWASCGCTLDATVWGQTRIRLTAHLAANRERLWQHGTRPMRRRATCRTDGHALPATSP